jgi:hypothetical protein
MLRAFAVLIMCAAVIASAKCVRETYEVSGQLRARDGAPIQGANITVKWGGSANWNSGTESTSSNGDGSFAIVIPFDTLSGDGALGDICEGRLAAATIDVSANGYRAKHERVTFASRKAYLRIVLEPT